MTNKKAQVTIFMIIGIIILIIGGFLVFINSSQEKEEIAPGVFISIKEIPTELDPVSNFVTTC